MKGKKTGGRQAGSLNKVTSISKNVLSDLLTDYNSSGLMSSDFMDLEPKERIQVAEKFMQYLMPKVQSVAIDINKIEDNKTIEDELSELSKESE